ncbi:hypothetical protein [Halorientalis salina]|uniref:hypothetical protein n=1 Tax=Halorientalis salina TaxID=2932266 RepID=UPI0010AC4F87|nr:hypothetical protein [Halorientalis salina]
MVLSKLTGRLPDSLRDRLPGRPDGLPNPPSVGTPDVPVDVPDVRPDADALPGVDDADGDKLTLGLTVVTLAGLGLATAGVVGRLVLDKLRSRGAEADRAETPDEPGVTDVTDERVETATEGDVAATTDTEDLDAADVATADETDDVDVETVIAEPEDSPPEPDGTVETPLADEEPKGEPDDESATPEESVTGDTPSTRTTPLGARASETSDEPSEPPRIAPLVGMVALVGMKFVVERLGGDAVEA